MGLTLTYQILDFLLLPLCILVGIAFYESYAASKRFRLGRYLCVGVGVIVLLVAFFNVYNLFAPVSLQELYMGYFWLYRAPEFAASTLIATSSSGLSVAGDMKVSYLLNGYYNIKVDAFHGYEFLGGDDSAQALLYVYPEMATNWYVIYYGNTCPLPQNWRNKLIDLNHVYSNNMVYLYAE